ncbi:hypothetical protein MMYC01_201474 [Madurella mycetomatis]|uniref:Uncharacterized protein n=1 Tax=Madurella mycetomatis TaxID=100816 RepID=A0A175VW13_9PEZI|nr:hypothetical protein MMYC01_207873 [Madurella mycetomatis]KXX81979.1 hypothetical protein MMYC01_201474 [Madurella mycetomatis]
MSNQLDLSLPSTAPAVGRYHDQPMELRPAALYTLVDLSDEELQELQHVCESQSSVPAFDSGSNVRLPPRPSFVGEPLRAAVEYHLELNDSNQGAFDPIHFVVAFHEDWRASGVLLVTLDDDDLECKTDFFKVRAQDSGVIIVGLQLGNTDWSESKECYSIQLRVSDGNGGNNDGGGNGGAADDGNVNSGPSPPDDPGSPSSGPVPPHGPTALGYYIGVYAVAGVDTRTIIRALEPGPSNKQPQNFNCRLQAVLPPSTSDPASVAMDLHASRCATNPWLHKFFLLVADTPDPSTNGILLASLGGQAKTKTFPPRATQRLPCTAKDAVQAAICTMAQGLRAWIPPAGLPAVVVFRYDTGRQPLEKVAALLDPQWDRRASGEEVLVFAPGHERVKGRGLKRVQYSLQEAVRRWPALCFDERFRGNLTPQYFICVDNGDVEREGVALVQVAWDGDVSPGREKMSEIHLGDSVEMWRVEARKAYQTLKGVIEGVTKWEGTHVGNDGNLGVVPQKP